MARDLANIFREASQLSEKDRAALAGLLIESLERRAEPGAAQAWADEITRRVAELDAGTVETIPWETVREELFSDLNED